MEKKEDRRVTLTKRMLKDALIDLLREVDIYHVSIRELCQRADVNRTTFYKYYGSQFDLAEAVFPGCHPGGGAAEAYGPAG